MGLRVADGSFVWFAPAGGLPFTHGVSARGLRFADWPFAVADGHCWRALRCLALPRTAIRCAFAGVATWTLMSLLSGLTNIASEVGVDLEAARVLAQSCNSSGIFALSDLAYMGAMLRNDRDTVLADLFGATRPTNAITLLDAAVKKLSPAMEGVAALAARRVLAAADASRQQAPKRARTCQLLAPALPSSSKQSSAKRHEIRLSKLALAIAKGKASDVVGPSEITLAGKAEKDMTEAKSLAMKLFSDEGEGSPRHVQFFGQAAPDDQDLGLLHDGFTQGSKSAKAVIDNVRNARAMIDDFKSLGWSLASVTEWQVARWLRARRLRCKSGKASALRALKWTSVAFGLDLHIGKSLVSSQVCLKQQSVLADEPSKGAQFVDIWICKGLEQQISSAPTAQLRCFAGLAAMSVHRSCRFSCANRSRDVQIHYKEGRPTTITGESVVKNQSTWSKWSCLATGFTDEPWAETFVSELHLAGLPGADYLLRGVNDCATSWLDRVADVNDAERCFRLLLQLPPISMHANDAVDYTWHGLRHTLVTFGTQLQVGERALEEFGNWKKGSNMPDVYNSITGARGLLNRQYVITCVRNGWEPVGFGEIPNPPPSGIQLTPGATACTTNTLKAASENNASEKEVGLSALRRTAAAIGATVVRHKVRNRMHLYDGGGMSVCGTWQVESSSGWALEAERLSADGVSQCEIRGVPACRPCIRGRAGRGVHGS